MIKEKVNIKTNKGQLAALHQKMLANNDQENAEKILDLYDKFEKEELIISFSGHFSAGKSSIINALLGQDILPKSPIPTSANIVKMTSGKGWARVFFNDSETIEYREPYDLDMIKEYSMDKDTIRKIEISTAKPIIPYGSAIIDTPGIDAADDADRLMTEGALHLVDVLFYVMDYNHVQSEVNLYFLQSLQEKNIPFYLIINQIDKHNERELSFTRFADSIEQTFSQWNIRPKDIFFTSLFDFSLEMNQFSKVKKTLFSMMQDKSDQYFNMDASVKQVINKHKKFLQDQYEELLHDIADDEALESQLSEIKVLEEKINQLKDEPEQLEKEFNQELTSTLHNAYLMPKELRDKAERYLESEQTGFKVGLFSSKKKTEEERIERLTDFMESLQGIIESAVQWKLRDKFLTINRNYSITDVVLQDAVNKFTITYDTMDLKKLIKPGAQVNGDYVLNYTNDVADDIKRKFKRNALDLLGKIKTALKDKNAQSLAEQQDKFQNLSEAQALKEKSDKIQNELEMKLESIDAQLASPSYNEASFEEAYQEYGKKNNQFIVQESPVEIKKESKQKINRITEDRKEKEDKLYSVDNIINRINQALEAVQALPGFNDLMDDLRVKKQRLVNRTYTIALFGAFSAGKSSFSNALIGERVLPVSPNPTTATVNRIHPVSKEKPHGTVIVTMKNEKSLFKELLAMTEKFSPAGKDFTQLIHWIQKKKIYQYKNLNKTYQAYIQALITGYETINPVIGQQVAISLDDFATYVTDETIACYIETIDLYYNSPITNQGITLVDTPGADSVNARHTNVAFDYIKHADAILYVTYYNHALSRADRDFLMQLGRVKEAFQLDKMFFIVNAADLAENEKELNLVLSYVQDELVKLGIRNAKLFPVSSKQSLEEKLDGVTLNEQMKTFESNFSSFIHHDLAALIVESALWDIRRVHDTLDHYIASVTLDAGEKEKQKQQIKLDEAAMDQFVADYETAVYEQQIKQRIEKQLFYVIERLGIRFHDMFKEMFNPTTITENGRRANEQLTDALENLLEYVRFELNQELQAVSLRVEGMAKELAGEVYRVFITENKAKNALFDLPNEYTIEIQTPTYKEKIEEISIKEFQHILGKYRGTKAFFVQNEKETMKEQLYAALLPFADGFIKDNEEIMIASYSKQWEVSIKQMKESTNQKLHQHVINYFAMLDAPIDFELLERNLTLLKQLVQEEEAGEV